LSATNRWQVDVFAEIDGPHATGADQLEQLVAVGDEEAPPAALQQLAGLELGQHAFADEQGGEVVELGRGGA